MFVFIDKNQVLITDKIIFTIPLPRFSGTYTSVTIAIDKLTLPLLRPPIIRDQTNKENVVAFDHIM